MKKRVWAVILSLILLSAVMPTAFAATAGYTLRIDGGKTGSHLKSIDGTPCLKVDLYLDGVTDSRLLSALSFDLKYDASQLTYSTDSQELGVFPVYAVDANGQRLGKRTLLINDIGGTVRCAFASDYGCRIETDQPLITFYFKFASVMNADTSITFTLGSGASAESVVMSAQTPGDDTDIKITQRSVGADFAAFKVSSINATVSFNEGEVQYKGKTPYVVYSGNAQKPGVTVKNKSGATVGKKYYTVSYSSNTKPGTASVKITFRNGYGGTMKTWFKIYLPGTTKTYVSNTKSGIRISWAPVSGAKGYVIYRRAWNLKSDGWTTFERWNNTTKTFWTDPNGNAASGTPGGVYAGTRYEYGVKAYYDDPMDNYNLGLVGPLKTTVRIPTCTLSSVTAGSGRMTVQWTGSALFTGYQIQYATDSAFTENAAITKIADPAAHEKTIKALTSGKTYYVRVRSYHVFEGKTYYGGWSAVKTCKVK